MSLASLTNGKLTILPHLGYHLKLPILGHHHNPSLAPSPGHNGQPGLALISGGGGSGSGGTGIKYGTLVPNRVFVGGIR